MNNELKNNIPVSIKSFNEKINSLINSSNNINRSRNISYALYNQIIEMKEMYKHKAVRRSEYMLVLNQAYFLLEYIPNFFLDDVLKLKLYGELRLRGIIN